MCMQSIIMIMSVSYYYKVNRPLPVGFCIRVKNKTTIILVEELLSADDRVMISHSAECHCIIQVWLKFNIENTVVMFQPAREEEEEEEDINVDDTTLNPVHIKMFQRIHPPVVELWQFCENICKLESPHSFYRSWKAYNNRDSD